MVKRAGTSGDLERLWNCSVVRSCYRPSVLASRRRAARARASTAYHQHHPCLELRKVVALAHLSTSCLPMSLPYCGICEVTLVRQSHFCVPLTLQFRACGVLERLLQPVPTGVFHCLGCQTQQHCPCPLWQCGCYCAYRLGAPLTEEGELQVTLSYFPHQFFFFYLLLLLLMLLMLLVLFLSSSIRVL